MIARCSLASRLVLVVALLTTSVFTSAAASASSATTLLLVVDGTGSQDIAWWIDGVSPEPTPFEDAATRAQQADLRTGREVSDGRAISSVYRQARLSTANIANLGRLFDASFALHGTVKKESARVAAADEFVAHVVFDAVLVDTRTQTVVDTVQLHAAGVGESAESAVRSASTHLVAALEHRLGVLTGSAPVAHDDAPMRVTVDGTGTAMPFVAFRKSLREAVGPRGDIMECAASEGSVTLCVRLESQASREGVVDSIKALEGRYVDASVSVQRVVGSTGGFVVTLDTESVPATPDLPFQ